MDPPIDPELLGQGFENKSPESVKYIVLLGCVEGDTQMVLSEGQLGCRIWIRFSHSP